MQTGKIIGLAMSGLAKQKMRTFLMMLGIIMTILFSLLLSSNLILNKKRP